MDNTYTLKKLTDCRWANLYEMEYTRRGRSGTWIICSRKDRPVEEAGRADAVVIVPIVRTPMGNRLVVTREFRMPIWDYEYGFPAGIMDGIEPVEACVRRELKEETGLDLVRIHHMSLPVYSTAGLSDESCHMVLAEAQGDPSKEYLEESEDIEVLLLDAGEVQNLLDARARIAAKAWGLLYHFAVTGRIEFPKTPVSGT